MIIVPQGRPLLPNPFDDRPSRLKTKAAITYSFLVAANIAAWVWALSGAAKSSFMKKCEAGA